LCKAGDPPRLFPACAFATPFSAKAKGYERRTSAYSTPFTTGLKRGAGIMKKDIYQEATDEILAQLKKGTRPWKQSWKGAGAFPHRFNDEKYRGINVIMLWVRALDKGFCSPYWMTFKQAHELGGNVKKGEKGTAVFYANTLTVKEENPEGDDEERIIPYMKKYVVFNADQIEGLPKKYYFDPTTEGQENFKIEEIENFINNIGLDYTTEGQRAFFSPKTDSITMPAIELFKNSQAYYATFLHEITHWTGAEKRLDREQRGRGQDKQAYAFEELVAEIGSCFLCIHFGLDPEIEIDHAPYIQSWIEVLENDHKAIFKAAAEAQKAVEFLNEKCALP